MLKTPPRARRILTAVCSLALMASCASAPIGVSRETPIPPRGIGGSYSLSLGEVGPGGGVVFYVSPVPFRCGSGQGKECTYLEYAPDGWFDGSADPRIEFLPPGLALLVSVTSQSLGAGWENTSRILAAAPSNSAASLARSYRGGGFTDWSLPASQELNSLCRFVHGSTSVGDSCETSLAPTIGFAPDFYWGSYTPSPGLAWYQNFSSGGQSSIEQGNTLRVRPVRAFGASGVPDAVPATSVGPNVGPAGS